MEELLKRMRLLETDHEPDGWPAVRMRDITALLDEVDRRSGIGGELIAARRERDAAQIENARLRRVLKAASADSLHLMGALTEPRAEGFKMRCINTDCPMWTDGDCESRLFKMGCIDCILSPEHTGSHRPSEPNANEGSVG